MAIHDRVLEAIGGRAGIRDVGLLQSIAERPKIGMMGQEFYPDIYSKTAALLEGLATYHVFTDGNKRTAITVAGIFLRANGHELMVSNQAAYRFVLAAAQKKKSVEEVAKWLKKHAKRLSRART